MKNLIPMTEILIAPSGLTKKEKHKPPYPYQGYAYPYMKYSKTSLPPTLLYQGDSHALPHPTCPHFFHVFIEGRARGRARARGRGVEGIGGGG